MPGMNGAQFYHQLQQHPVYQQIPFILMTALLPHELKSYLMQPVTVFRKPFNIRQLLETVDHLLARS
jgi:CheY-like chemotaxis protein